jgi:outer membrane protein assembly factor BamB
VYVLNAGTGAPIWHYTFDAEDVGSPIVANGVVYFGSWSHIGDGTGDYTITALDANTGAFLWNTSEHQGELDILATPAVVNGVIYGTAVTEGSFAAFSLPN